MDSVLFLAGKVRYQYVHEGTTDNSQHKLRQHHPGKQCVRLHSRANFHENESLEEEHEDQIGASEST